jgi:hypothetical protein
MRSFDLEYDEGEYQVLTCGNRAVCLCQKPGDIVIVAVAAVWLSWRARYIKKIIGIVVLWASINVRGILEAQIRLKLLENRLHS